MKRILFFIGFLFLMVSAIFLFIASDFLPRQNEFKTLKYSESEYGDLWVPQGQGPFPIVVVVHGGGWVGRDKSDMTRICRKLKENGIAAFNINYRLVPKSIYPAQIEDFKSATKYLAINRKQFNIDISKVGSWGYSAGSQIATLGAFQMDEDIHFKVIVDGAGPLDLTMYPDNPLAISYLGKTISEDPNLFKTSSPVFVSTSKSPPMFIYHSTNDQLVHFEHSLEMKKKLEENHVSVELYSIPILGHYLTFFLSTKAEDLAVRFIKEKFKN
jgi:acetyl esterase/lipase